MDLITQNATAYATSWLEHNATATQRESPCQQMLAWTCDDHTRTLAPPPPPSRYINVIEPSELTPEWFYNIYNVPSLTVFLITLRLNISIKKIVYTHILTYHSTGYLRFFFSHENIQNVC